MGFASEITSIERVDTAERKLGIALQGLFAKVSELAPGDYWLEVNGDVVASSGRIESDIEIVVSAHDSRGRVVATNANTLIESDKFFGLDAFSASLQIPTGVVVERVRVFPKPF